MCITCVRHAKGAAGSVDSTLSLEFEIHDSIPCLDTTSSLGQSKSQHKEGAPMQVVILVMGLNLGLWPETSRGFSNAIYVSKELLEKELLLIQHSCVN